MTEPKWVVAAVAAIGLSGTGAWYLLSRATPADVPAEAPSAGSAFDMAANVEQAQMPKLAPELERGPSRRLNVVPMEIGEASASVAPEAPRPSNTEPRKLPDPAPGAAGMQVGAGPYAVGAAQPFRAPGALAGKMSSDAGLASPSGGGGPAMPRAAANAGQRAAPDANATAAAAQAMAAARAAPAAAAKARSDRAGLTSETRRTGLAAPSLTGSAAPIGATAAAAAAQGGPPAGAAGAKGGAALNGPAGPLGGGAAGAGGGGGGFNPQGNLATGGGDVGGGGGAAPAVAGGGAGANANADMGAGAEAHKGAGPVEQKEQAKGGQLDQWRQALLTQAKALSAGVGQPAAAQIAKLARAYAAGASAAVGPLESLGQRAAADQAYFNGANPQPAAAASLADVDRALHDPSEGTVTRLNVEATSLNAAAACLDGLAANASRFENADAAIQCHARAEVGLSQRSRDLQKITSIRHGIDTWAAEAMAAFRARCPDPANPTPQQKPSCDGLARVQASHPAYDGWLGAAAADLPSTWHLVDVKVVGTFPGLIDLHRTAVADIRNASNLVAGIPAEGRRMVSDAIQQLDFASAGWKKALGSAPVDDRSAMAAQAEEQLVRGIADLREASRIMGSLVQNAPK